MNCITTKHMMFSTSEEAQESCNDTENSGVEKRDSSGGEHSGSGVQKSRKSEKAIAETEMHKNIGAGDYAYTTKKMTAKLREKDSFSNEFSVTSAQNGDDTASQMEVLNHEDETASKSKASGVAASTKLDGANAASDFLQKMVQEQKSQVPTLFCRELPVLNDASKVYNTMDLKSSAKLFIPLKVPNSSSSSSFSTLSSAADARLGLHARKNTTTTSILSSAAKSTLFCSEFDTAGVSGVGKKNEPCKYRISADNGDNSTPSDEGASSSSTTAEKNSVSSELNGKLRFYLDGQFVLELMHAKNKRGSTGSWVQSKGKIWTPVSQAPAEVVSRSSGRRSIFPTAKPQPLQSTVVDLPNSGNSVSSLFMVQTTKIVRWKYLCWLSRKEIRRAARNSSLNIYNAYQAALQKNHPVQGINKLELHKIKTSVRHKRKTLNDLFKVLQSHRLNSNHLQSSVGALGLMSATMCKETSSKTNKSLLLSALTKPNVKEERLPEGESSQPTTRSPVSAALLGDAPKLSLKMMKESWNFEQLNSIKDRSHMGLSLLNARTSPDHNTSLANYVPKVSKSECAASALLPLPDWYLDPSKAEVPVSEMIGYPRPYFPPASAESPSHLAKKRHPDNVSSAYPVYMKKLCLKKEVDFKDKCLKSEETSYADSGLMRESYTNRWLSKESFVDCADESISPPIARVKSLEHIDSESASDYTLSNSSDAHLKARCAKRFGSYGRGHAVNEAIRTFVISDIVNLGGDVESRYVPRGVYPEVASRYKIDVSTTTRWWLKYCADYEHSLKRGETSSAMRNVSPGPDSLKYLKLPEQVDNASPVVQIPSSSIKSEFTLLKMKNPISLKKMYISSHMQETSSDRNKNCHKDNYAMRHEVSPFNEGSSSHAMEEVPLDLSVKRIKTENSNDSIQYARNVGQYSTAMVTAKDKTLNRVFLDTNHFTALERVSPIDHSAFVNKNSPTNDLQRHVNSIAENDDQMFAKSDHSNEGRTSAHSSDFENDGDPSLPSNADARHLKNVPISSNHHCANLEIASRESHGSSRSSASKPSDSQSNISRMTSVEMSALGSQTSKVVTSKPHSSLKLAACDDEMNSKTKPLCLGLNGLHKSEYSSLGMPMSGMPSDYSGLPPPPHGSPIALASWPYPPCPVMAYGPALINSYYYCCCFLPGCRFHYIYSPNSQTVDTGNTLTASPSLLVANGYTKCCPSVADVSPMLLDSVYPNNVYKSWESSVSDAKVKHSDLTLPKAKSPLIAVEETPEPSIDTPGSMLKHLLLKPSRLTPDTLPAVVATSCSLTPVPLLEGTNGSRPSSVSSVSRGNGSELPLVASPHNYPHSPVDVNVDVALSHSTNKVDDDEEEEEDEIEAVALSPRSPVIHVSEDSSDDDALQIVLTDALEESSSPSSEFNTRCVPSPSEERVGT